MAVIHKGVDKIQDSSSPPNLVTIAELRTTVDSLSGKANVGDSYTKTEADSLLANKADTTDVYTKANVDGALAAKADVAHAHTLDSLTDVTATGATDGQSLVYNSGSWAPATVTSGGGGATTLGGLSDVDLTTTAPQSLDVLQYNGTQWEPAAISGGGGTSNVANLDDLTDVNAATPAGGQVLAWSSTNNTWEPANPTTADAVVLANSGIVYSTDGIDDEYELGQPPVLTLSINNPQNGEALVFDSSSGDWVNQSVSQAFTLNDLTDVTAAGATSGQVLASDGAGNWTPTTISGGGGSSNVAVMDDLTDVDTTTTAPTDQQVLAWDASNSVWSPTSFSAASGSGSADLGIAVTTAGGDVDYEFNAATPSGVPSMDTTSLAVGSTMMWNGSSWVDSGLVIETYT